MRLIVTLGAPLCAAILALSACSSNAAGSAAEASATSEASATAAVHPVSGLRVISLTVTSTGKPRRFRVELAGNAAEQSRGLMFRTAMGADEGMIFPIAPPRQAAFWMKNTVIPLDIIFIGADGRISNMWESTVPYSEDSLPSTGLVKGVLELNAGRAKQLGIHVGDLVEW